VARVGVMVIVSLTRWDDSLNPFMEDCSSLPLSFKGLHMGYFL
jgi:hypothetical protein